MSRSKLLPKGKPAERIHLVNVRWKPTEKALLDEIGVVEGRSISEVIRTLAGIGATVYSVLPSFNVLRLTDIAEVIRESKIAVRGKLLTIDFGHEQDKQSRHNLMRGAEARNESTTGESSTRKPKG